MWTQIFGRPFLILSLALSVIGFSACSGGSGSNSSSVSATVSQAGIQSPSAAARIQEATDPLNADPNYALTQADLDQLRESGALVEGDAPAVALLVKR